MIVAITDAFSHRVESPSEHDGTGPDSFEAQLPVITSVTDEQTAKNSGSILGGDTVIIKGSGFVVPAGGSSEVRFRVASPQEEFPVNEVTVVSPTEIKAKVPNMAAAADKIPSGKTGLATDVIVAITDAFSHRVESPSEHDGTGPDSFEAQLPVITSVTDEQTAKNSGSILGGDTVIIKGSGFVVPAGGSSEVRFRVASPQEEFLVNEVTVVSPTEIKAKVPNMAAAADKIPSGKTGLATDVIVAITDAFSHRVESPSEHDGTGPDAFEALRPLVNSVEDQETHTNEGSILGGDTLKIKGEGFGLPKGGHISVLFYSKGGVVKRHRQRSEERKRQPPRRSR